MSTPDLRAPEPAKIREIFDGIAARYDRLNTLLSFGLDRKWRRKAAERVMERPVDSLLDLGVGTGKFLECFLTGKRRPSLLAGIDFSGEMLAVARRKLPQNIRLVRGDFHRLPFAAASFEAVISAFILRSVRDLPGFFQGVLGLLKPRGRAFFLCLTRPEKFPWRLGHRLYLKGYVPLVGKMLSGRSEAYDFLSQSVQHFQEPAETLKIMEQQGFKSCTACRWSGGIVTLLIGERPA
ncbi:MAG: ubiquinone/menaquinone biosynthesis methyltransferase [Candidatus Omnitrophota bacterium]